MDPELNRDVESSKKPTHLLVHGVMPGVELPQCNEFCSLQLDGRHVHRHRRVVAYGTCTMPIWLTITCPQTLIVTRVNVLESGRTAQIQAYKTCISLEKDD